MLENKNCVAINAADYMDRRMRKEMEEFAKSNKIKTGYANLDDVTNLYPGLYVLGAISSLGKTTFIHQMADQMARSGEKVIFFSLEQSALELATKSLARTMAQKDASKAMTSLQIRENGSDERVEEAISEYKKYANNLTLVECTFDVKVDDICKYVEDYILDNCVKPIVIVDYLQVIQPNNPKQMTRDAVDTHVKKLKELQRDNKIVLIVISSINRQNYLSQVDFESFKETGGIEYTADVLWGLQLRILAADGFEDKGTNEKRKLIKKAKASMPRKIQLVCLKNRFGISSYTLDFEYYPHVDLFKPQIEKEKKDQKVNKNWKIDKDGLKKIPNWAEEELPFCKS